MNWIWTNFLSLLTLLVGGICVIEAMHGLVRHRSIVGMVLMLLFGAAVATPALLNLMGLIASQWVNISRNIVVGLWLVWTSIWALYSPPSPSFPKWTQWAGLVIGVGAILVAIYELLQLA